MGVLVADKLTCRKYITGNILVEQVDVASQMYVGRGRRRVILG